MDPLKPETYSNEPASLEKGPPPVQPLYSEPCHGYSTQPVQTRRRFRRHWFIFGIAALTWLAYSYGKRAFNDPRHQVWSWVDEKVGYPPPPADEDGGECVGSTNWTTYYDKPPWAPDYPYGAETTFSLPINADALYLVSRGAFQHGLVNIEQSKQVAETAAVRVRVAYHDDKALEHATVCQMEREENEQGIGIYTPWVPPRPSRLHRHGLEFDVTLTLPAGNAGPLSVKKLETKLPNYDQEVADLGESVVFDVISLQSVNGELSVESVTADVGHFWSVNGEIDGHFNIRSSLDLRTVNGLVTPTVNLLHRKDADPTNLTIHTVNGQTDAEISLTSEASTGGEFGVHAQSVHGNVELTFDKTPVDSVLRCQAEATVGAVEVELDSAFEGGYSLQSLLGKKSLAQRDVEDPAGKGRRRVVSVNEARGRVDGEIKWEKNGNSAEIGGYVVLKALVASVELIV